LSSLPVPSLIQNIHALNQNLQPFIERPVRIVALQIDIHALTDQGAVEPKVLPLV
jgi:hypothetical protein